MDTRKYKTGEKVCVNKNVGEAKAGTILTVGGSSSRGWWFEETGYWLPESDLDPVNEAPPTADKVVSDGSSTDYYKLPENPEDLLDLIEHKRMSFGVGNIFKACYRLGEKSGTDAAYDLRKMIFFATRELSRLQKYRP